MRAELSELMDARLLASAIKEAVMLKLFLLLFAGTLFALAPARTFALTPQQATPQAPAAAQPAAPTGPMPIDAANPVKPAPAVLAKAKTLFNMDCSMCHGESGNGQSDVAKSMGLTLDNWTDPKALAGKPDGLLFDIIRNGNGKMPAETKDRANDTAVWGLVLYIRSFSQSQPPTAGSAPQ